MSIQKSIVQKSYNVIFGLYQQNREQSLSNLFLRKHNVQETGNCTHSLNSFHVYIVFQPKRAPEF